MTSLAEQLKKLTVPQTSILTHSKKKSSLLFDPKDAADISRDKFYQIGLNGLQGLIEIDHRFAEFEKSLFDETSIHLERAVEDHQANAKLDQMINRFLILLVPYLNIKASHKALEWLICRFHIHQYNVDSILALFIPYHETNIFARMVQILSIQDKGGRWLWLQTLKKEGIPMAKQFLLSRASSDTSFFKFICNLPLQGIQVHGKKSYCLTTLFSFYSTTVIGALHQTPHVSEVQITHLLPSLMAGIGSSHVDFTASAFMILGYLVTKVRLTTHIYSELFYKVCRSEVACLRKEAVLVLVVMAQSIRPPTMLPAISHLATCSWFIPTLAQQADSGVVVFPLVAAIITDCWGALNSADTDKQDLLQTFVKALLEKLSFNDDEAKTLFKLLAETSVPKGKWYHALLNQLEKAHPQSFDEVVKCHPKLLDLVPEYADRNEFFQRLSHPKSHIRLKAIQHISANKQLLEENWVREALVDLLEDEKVSIVSAVLSLDISLPTEKLMALVARCWNGSSSTHVLVAPALRRLPPDINQMLLTLPFLLPTDKEALATAKEVLQSDSVKSSSLLKPLYAKLVVHTKNQIEDMETSDQEGQNDELNLTEQSLSKAVFKFILKDMKGLSYISVLEAGKQLEHYGCIYNLMSLLIAACILPDKLTPDCATPLFQRLMEYNTSPSIIAKPRDELKPKNFASIVSVCQNEKLPYQGSLFVLSLLMGQIKAPLPEGKCIYNVRDPEVSQLVDVFKIVLQMKDSKNTHIQAAYSNFCIEMFQKCCETTEGQIDLLSNMALGYPTIAGECLSLIAQLLQDQTSMHETVLVPSLMVALGAQDDKVRHSAVSLLHSLGKKLALPTYHRLIDQLTQYSEEITLDHEQVNVALYMCLSPDPSVQSLLDKSLRSDFTLILNVLLDLITSDETPDYVKSSILMTLDQINSQSVLEKLLPLGLKIFFSDKISEDEFLVLNAVIKRINVSTAKIFVENHPWMFVETCLSLKSHTTIAVQLLQQVDRDFFAALNTTQQQRLLRLIVRSSALIENGDLMSAVVSCVKRLVLDSAVVASLLQPMIDVTLDTLTEGTKKRAWVGKKSPPLELLTTVPWTEGICLLELIQNKKKLDNVHILIPTLFEILNRCLQFEEQSPVEYTKQLLLTSLLHCCTKITPGTDLPQSGIQVDLVVECVRASPNPQTHHHALLLLAHIAIMIPERVLHSIMPIFTFMGSCFLRQDDTYSFQIISKIIETIVPILRKTGTEQTELSPEVVGVLRVFAGALLDVPEHRRTPLFTKLLETLDHGSFLWAFIALVCESHVLNFTPQSASASDTVRMPGTIPQRLEVGLQLCHQFPPSTILSTSCRLINYLHSLPIDKSDKKLEIYKKNNVSALFDIEQTTAKQFRHYRYTVLTFLSLLLSSKKFLNHMAKLSTEDLHSLNELYKQIFEGILAFTQFVSKQVDSDGGQFTGKYWTSIYNICFDVMAKTNALLPGDMFLEVVASLLDHELAVVGCKALELLNWRLQQTEPMDANLLLGLLPQLMGLVKNKDTAAVMQQTALLSIKFLARQLAAEHPFEFQSVFKAVTKMVKKRAMHDPVLASAVLCFGELCHTMGAHAIVSLPTFMPALLNVLQNLKPVGSSSGDLLLVSTVSALHKLTDSLANFLSPYLAQLLQHLSVLSANCIDHGETTRPLTQKIKSIRQKISSDVPLRVLLPAVSESYSQLVSASNLPISAIPTLLSILGDSFKSGVQLTPEISTFFLHVLEFRIQNCGLIKEIEMVESSVISTIIALILKLSESSFRPFYYKIFTWTGDCKNRLITFYKLTSAIAESLKGLFVSFADYFLKNASSLMDETNVTKQKVTWSQAQELLEAVLRTLLVVFLHDTSHFVTKERFDTLMQPLVDQLENSLGGEDSMVLRTKDLVIPCLTQMAVSAADDTLWKQLNYQILLKTRHSDPQVRIGGALAVCEVAKKLGEEFLPLLPETVPFLAELLEDEIENVEKTSERVVQELEAALGEPISKYF